MGSKFKRPIQYLEKELLHVKEQRLIQDVIYNPHLSECYILISFYPTTPKSMKEKILQYIQETYDIIDAKYIQEDDTIYVIYDYWSRYVRER